MYRDVFWQKFDTATCCTLNKLWPQLVCTENYVLLVRQRVATAEFFRRNTQTEHPNIQISPSWRLAHRHHDGHDVQLVHMCWGAMTWWPKKPSTNLTNLVFCHQCCEPPCKITSDSIWNSDFMIREYTLYVHDYILKKDSKDATRCFMIFDKDARTCRHAGFERMIRMIRMIVEVDRAW